MLRLSGARRTQIRGHAAQVHAAIQSVIPVKNDGVLQFLI